MHIESHGGIEGHSYQKSDLLLAWPEANVLNTFSRIISHSRGIKLQSLQEAALNLAFRSGF